MIPNHRTLAQDSAFTDCARFSDRAERIACLEDALEAATTRTPSAEEAPAEPVAVQPSPIVASPAPAVTEPATAPEPEQQVENEQERIADFGQSRARIEEDDSGVSLHDTIVALERRRDMWHITLSSGQVWIQEYPKRYNLREGDAITIEQKGFGNGFRLSADRLSGFIRVERIDDQ